MELWTAFLLGLVGSLHCAGMCGPLALALPAAPGGRASFLAGRLAYNGGRVATYGALGLMFGLLGKGFNLAGAQRWLSIALGVTILFAFAWSRKWTLGAPLIGIVTRVKGWVAIILRRRALSSLLLLGLLNGLLPCGLVYVAGASAATRGTPVAGAGFMLLFGLGTVPMMLGIALARRPLQAALRFRLQPLVPAAALALGGLLVLRGLGLGIPYLSPILTDAHGLALKCH